MKVQAGPSAGWVVDPQALKVGAADADEGSRLSVQSRFRNQF